VIFSSTLFTRLVDPIIPMIAADLAVDVKTAALLSTAFALPYALTQPILGPIADMTGKTRLMIACLMLASITSLIASVAADFSTVLVMRVLAGMVAGGVFPVGVALVGDLVPIERRQIAISRLLAAGFTGNLIGSTISGVLGDLVGWRGVFVSMGSFGLLAAVVAMFAWRGLAIRVPVRFSFKAIPANYRSVLANPRAKVCYGAVFVEGIFLHGLFPYVALLLLFTGETRASIAGIVIAGFGVGGIIYTIAVSHLLTWFSETRLMIFGGLLAAGAMLVVAVGIPWPQQVAAFIVMGFGFYCLHGCIQVHVTELSPTARGSAMGLHSSSFFLGQASGPVVYGIGIASVGAGLSIGIGAIAILGVALVCARYLPIRKPSE
jgi:predicted MFS family arabinose efflux permease